MYPLAGSTSDRFIGVIGLGILPLDPRMHVEACDWAAEGNTSHALFDGRTMREALIYDKFGVAKLYARCPLWVKSRHLTPSKACPLYPQKRTFGCDELMSALCQKQTKYNAIRVAYSTSSSAMLSKPEEMVRPSALAVFMLITSSNLVGCMTGRSAGFSPLRIRPVRIPPCWYRTAVLGP